MIANKFKNASLTMAGVASALMIGATPVSADDAASSAPSSERVRAATVQEKDCRTHEIVFCKAGAEKVSASKLTILVFDGEERLYSEVVKGATRLSQDGYPVAIIRGQDIDRDPSSIGVQFYAKGASHIQALGFSENLNDKPFANIVYESGKEVAGANFKPLSGLSAVLDRE